MANGLGTDAFNYQSSQKNLQIIISQAGDTSSFSPLPSPDLPVIFNPDSEPSTMEIIKKILTKPVDFIREKLGPKAQVTPADEEKERIYFPENYDQVSNYSENRQTKFKKAMNQFKSLGKILGKTGSNLLVLLFLILFVFLAVVIFIKLKKKRENIQPQEQANEH